jgi:rhodanese-related sulfurtransferase
VIRRAFLQALTLAGLALAPALVSGVVQLRHEKVEPLAPGEVRAGTARQWAEGVLYVDARPAARFEAGHIPRAVRLTEEDWETLWPQFLDAWDPEKTVVVYCDGGDCEASHEVAARLRREMQVETVFILKGGWPAWQRK